MGIRKAELYDVKAIIELLSQLGYPDTAPFLQDKLKSLLAHPDEKVLVYEYKQKVIALISIHFIPQLALQGDFARISYFVVDEKIRGKGIGRELEEYCVFFS